MVIMPLLNIMELTGLEILDSCLYDQRKVDAPREPLSVDVKFSG